MDIRLTGQFIKELHCVFCSEVEENGEGKTDSVIHSDIDCAHTHTHSAHSRVLFI